MNKYVNRLLWRSDGIKVPFLIFPFLLMTYSPGLFYTFFSDNKSIQESILYKLTVINSGPSSVSIWGAAALAAAIIATINIVFRKRWAGYTAPLLGYIVWLYAIFLYAENGYWSQITGYTLPQLIFWGWHYIRVRAYWINVDRGYEEIL